MRSSKNARPGKLEMTCWLVFFLVPLLTGWLDYRALPGEHYDSERHQVVRSHVEEAWPEGLGDYEVPDVWRDRASGEVYSAESFVAHHRAEAERLAIVWFGYGLIGCGLFTYGRRMRAQSPIAATFAKAAVVDLAVALFVYWLA